MSGQVITIEGKNISALAIEKAPVQNPSNSLGIAIPIGGSTLLVPLSTPLPSDDQTPAYLGIEYVPSSGDTSVRQALLIQMSQPFMKGFKLQMDALVGSRKDATTQPHTGGDSKGQPTTRPTAETSPN
jgi:hypothetical protein